MSLSNTSRLKQIEEKSKTCLFCKAMEVLEISTCCSTCHADSVRERRKIAITTRKLLEKRLDEVIAPELSQQHIELRPPVADVEVRLSTLEDRLEKLTTGIGAVKAPQVVDTRALVQRLSRLRDKLDSIDSDLACAVGESFDQEERIRLLCPQEEENRSLQRMGAEVRPIKAEITKWKNELVKVELDMGMVKVNVSKFSREQGNKRPYRSDKWVYELELQRKELSRENSSLKIRAKEREDQLKSLTTLLETRKSTVELLKSDLFAMSIAQHSISELSPASLLCITSQVFGPYKRINKFKRETAEKMDTLKVAIGTLKRK